MTRAAAVGRPVLRKARSPRGTAHAQRRRRGGSCERLAHFAAWHARSGGGARERSAHLAAWHMRSRSGAAGLARGSLTSRLGTRSGGGAAGSVVGLLTGWDGGLSGGGAAGPAKGLLGVGRVRRSGLGLCR